MKNFHSISAVVPVYNSEETILELSQQLNKTLSNITNKYEIIFINDDSHDNSWDAIKEIQKNNSKICSINLNRNFGQHNALLCGIRKAKYDLIVTLDDDLQNPPNAIPKLVQKIEEGIDVVYGVPFKENHGLLRNFASVFTKMILRSIMGIENARNVSAFRCFKTELRDAFEHYKGSFVSIDVLLSWGTKNFGSVKVENHDRAIGESNYTIGSLITHAVNMITGFSVLPLKIATYIGFSFSIFGIAVLGFVITRFLISGSPVQGFSFLASIIAIFSGAQLLSIGIIGEYLSRMHYRIMDKPQYFEKK